jgi:hypothetical protein
MINVTHCDLKKIIQEAYALSVPQGMGFMHFKPGPLSDEEVAGILSRYESHERIAVDMDYIKGRAVKMIVFKKDGGLYIHDNWYDHLADEYDDFLDRIGATREAPNVG